MNKWRAYIKPFLDTGAYAADWIEVTRDVDWGSLGNIQQGLDNADYDIGVYRNSNFNVTLRNDHGRYSDVDVLQSIFRYKRADSLFKITWDLNEDRNYCGATTVCGQFKLSEEMTLFEGLLNDESLAMDVASQQVTFLVLGREALLDRAIVPFASLSVGQLASAVILACVNQAPITSVLTVSAGTISLGNDQTLDNIDDLENKTAKDALDDLLMLTSSVLYIRDGALIISPRTPTAALQYTFFGQASNSGPENVQDIQKFKNGMSRVFNYLFWTDTAITSVDDSSVTKYGARSKEFNFTYFTNGVKQQSLLDSILGEFSLPKREMELTAPLTYDTLEVDLLDRVAIDYPTVYTSLDPLPICGIAICGEAKLPKGIWSFMLTTTEEFKVIGRTLDIRNALFKYKLREV